MKDEHKLAKESELSDLDPDEVRFINSVNRRGLLHEMAIAGELHIVGGTQLSVDELSQGLPFASFSPNISPPDIRKPFS